MAFWGYSRVFHLILLIILLTIYWVYYATMYYLKCPRNYDFDLPRVDEWYFPAVVVLFFGFWFLRGSECLSCLAPAFLYVTLIIELVVISAALVYASYTQAIYTTETFNSTEEYNYYVYILSILVIAVYVLLVFKYVSLSF